MSARAANAGNATTSITIATPLLAMTRIPGAYTGDIVKRLPVYFISHGGGPWSFMDDESRAPYTVLARELADMPRQVGMTPKAILMVSAHWEEPEFTLMANPRPSMIYDYGGFPDYTYRIRYDAPGDPVLAERARTLIEAAGFPARLDAERGFDHGTYTPLNVMYPRADVPVVQLSLKRGLDPVTHLALGRALAPLRDEGILVIGSGLTYHNLREFFSPRGWAPSREFDGWLQGVLLTGDPKERGKLLAAWEAAPAARAAHPREEHLLPLMVAVGAAENDRAELSYHETDFLGGLTVSNFRFLNPPL
jgi:aromatic ring-opening dioxygenase catalytic subunit (LigB family)